MSVITQSLGRGQIILGEYVLIECYDVQMKPHISDYELFESYEGIISIKKMLDKHAELSFKTLIRESIVEGYNPDNPEANRNKFVEFRNTFLDNVDGKSLVVVSDMFKPFRGVVTAKEYGVAGGETASEFSIEIREAGGTVGTYSDETTEEES